MTTKIFIVDASLYDNEGIRSLLQMKRIGVGWDMP